LAGTPSTFLMGFAPGSANREDLLDFITNVDPWETPAFTSFPKVKCDHVTHEWLTDTLAAATTAGGTEGRDFISEDRENRVRAQNVTQIFRKDIKVTNTQRAVNPAGVKDEYGYQIQKALKEIARDIESRLFAASGTSASGSTAAARLMKNLSDFYTTGAYTGGTTCYASFANAGTAVSDGGGTPWSLPGGSASSCTLMTEDRFNGVLEVVFNNGGNPDKCFVFPGTKRQISAFSGQGASRRNIAMTEKKLVASVDVYDSDFGLIQIVLDRWQRQDTTTIATSHAALTGEAIWLESGMNRIAFLRPLKHVHLAAVGDATRGMIAGELTLEVLSPKTGFRLLGCSRYSGPQG